MNRTFKYALTVAMGAALVIPALAQDNFPDVPENHWAYEALANMKKDGLLVGYPDGLYRGGRPASRYEMAVAIHATYQKLKGLVDGLTTQISSLNAALDGKADKADLQALRDALAALQNDVNGMKAWGDDIANLKKLASTFEKEIASLGVDVEAMKNDISDLKNRVDALEKRKPAVDIHGDVNLLAVNDYGKDGWYGVTTGGRPTGYNGNNAWKNMQIFHEGAFTLSGTNDEGPKWRATLVYGNMLGWNDNNAAMGDQVDTAAYYGFQEGPQSFYFQDFGVKFDTSLVGVKFSAEVGRIGYQVSPMFYQRPDATPEYANDRWDNGNWMMDGAVLGFDFGKVGLDLFGGKLSNAVGTGFESEIQPVYFGAWGSPFDLANDDRPVGTYRANLADWIMANNVLGAKLSVPISENIKLKGTYMILDSNDYGYAEWYEGYSDDFNRLAVYGGELNAKFGGIVLDGGYGKTDLQYNHHNVLTDNNDAWWATLGYEQNKWGVKAGYKNIEQNYQAPGDWGRIGLWWNPTDIKGFTGNLWFKPTEALSIKAGAEFYTGINDGSADYNYDYNLTGLTEDDKVNRYKIDLDYNVNPDWTLSLGYELVDWDLAGNLYTDAGKPQETWYKIGLGYKFNDKAKLTITWQISDYDGDGVDGFDFFDDTMKGGIVTTQLSVKF